MDVTNKSLKQIAHEFLTQPGMPYENEATQAELEQILEDVWAGKHEPAPAKVVKNETHTVKSFLKSK